MIHHNSTQIENLLLEWILALHFSESSSGLKVIPIVLGSYSLHENKVPNYEDDSVQKKKIVKEVKMLSDPHSFSLSIPHSGGRVEPGEYKHVDIVNLLTTVNKKLIPELTLLTADNLLKKNGQKCLSDEMKNLSIDQIISKLLLFQGIFLSGNDISSSRCSLKDLAGNQVDRLMKTLLTLYNDSSVQRHLVQTTIIFSII
jgi:hypothetical protein